MNREAETPTGVPSLARTLADAAHVLALAADAEERIRRVLDLLRDVVPYDRCALLEAPPGGDRRLTVVPESPDGQAGVLRRVTDLLDLVTEQHEKGLAGKALDARTSAGHSHLAVPLVELEDVVGVLLVEREGGEYAEEHLSLLSVIAADLAAYLTLLRLRDEERRRANDLERARSEAESANRSKDEFLALLSHELRSPLGATLTWVALLRAGRLDADTAARALETIERSTRLQVRLVEDLLDVSRIIAGKLTLETGPVELGSMVEAAVRDARGAADLKRIGIDLERDREEILVRGDVNRLQQILGNLLSNAIKFTPEGGSIGVRAERIGAEARLRIRDTGQGIDPTLLPHVFERFKQADSSSTRRHGGLGLGLALVRHLVELHGGRVTAESDGSGTGATFTVTLPIDPETVMRSGSAPGTPSKRQFADLHGVCVLVVDDDPNSRQLMTTVLSAAGAETMAAGSAYEALTLLKRRAPDVLVSDIAMPDTDGYALLRRIRAPEVGDRGLVPAIAVTALASTADRQRALAAGYQAHIAKPFDAVALVDMVAALIRSETPAPVSGR